MLTPAQNSVPSSRGLPLPRRSPRLGGLVAGSCVTVVMTSLPGLTLDLALYVALRNRLVQELLAWTIRTQDDLPIAAYKVKWPKRNWYASYHKNGLPPA